jgi:hypothetical protein
MQYREIIAVCSEIHTKHINTLCGQNVEFVNVKPNGTYSDPWASTIHYNLTCKGCVALMYSHHLQSRKVNCPTLILKMQANNYVELSVAVAPTKRVTRQETIFRTLVHVQHHISATISPGNPAKWTAKEPASRAERQRAPAVEGTSESLQYSQPSALSKCTHPCYEHSGSHCPCTVTNLGHSAHI